MANNEKVSIIKVLLALILALTATFIIGLWLGGYVEVLRLREYLVEIPDLNSCI